MLRPYAEILARPGAMAFSAAGFVARLPIAMVSLGIVLLLSGTGRSYGLAGAVSATQSLVNAFVGPRLARVADRHGQARVLVPAAVVQSAGLLSMVAGATAHAPAWVLFAAAFVSGASWLSVGSLVRARWSALVGGTPGDLHTAYALESVLDEVIFIVGPITVTVLATSVHPAAGLLAVVGLLLGGSAALAARRGTEPPLAGAAGGPGGPVLLVRGVWVVVAVFGALGLLFAALEVTVVAFTTEEGHRGATGAVLASYALGSMFAGLAYGSVQWRASTDRRFVRAAVAMGVSLLPLPYVPGVWQLAVLSFVAGFAISPTLISGNDLVQKLVPSGRLTEGLAWTTTGIALGLTAGSATAGRVVDAGGPGASFWVSTGAALAAAAVALAGARQLQPQVEA